MKLTNSPIEQIELFERAVFIKRDDLLDKQFNGNKARKFSYYLANHFHGINRLVSYGSPQANSLYALAGLAKHKKWQLDYYVNHIASQIIRAPAGNYQAAMMLGANIVNLSELPASGLSCREFIEQTLLPNDEILYIPEGGHTKVAEFGLTQLAQEIATWAIKENQTELVLVLPSGTGTTALYVNKFFVKNNIDIKVITTPTVGDVEYLKQQFKELEIDEQYHPRIVTLGKKFHYGKLYREFYDVWQATHHSGVTFDLIYDPAGLLLLRKLIQTYKGINLIYLHQGGVLGNETMLPRYQRKYPTSSLNDI